MLIIRTGCVQVSGLAGGRAGIHKRAREIARTHAHTPARPRAHTHTTTTTPPARATARRATHTDARNGRHTRTSPGKDEFEDELEELELKVEQHGAPNTQRSSPSMKAVRLQTGSCRRVSSDMEGETHKFMITPEAMGFVQRGRRSWRPWVFPLTS